MAKLNNTPHEDDEAVAFAQWLRINKIPATHIANEIGGSSRVAKMRSLKAKKMGQSAGVWDYEIFVPVYDIDGEVSAYQELRVELKRRVGGRTTDSQRQWGKIYEMSGIPCKVCKGATEAIDYVKCWMREMNGEETQ